jgi:hypothetical protein
MTIPDTKEAPPSYESYKSGMVQRRIREVRHLKAVVMDSSLTKEDKILLIEELTSELNK